MTVKKSVFAKYIAAIALLFLVMQTAMQPVAAQGVVGGIATTRANVADAVEARGGTFLFSMSDDGRYVAFRTWAPNIVDGDTNGHSDIFVRDRETLTTRRVSVASDGTEADSSSSYVAISADGRYVAFTSHASNLVSNDTNDLRDTFVHDMQTGETTRVSVRTDGTQAIGGDSWHVAISADGRFVAFSTDASNLIPGYASSANKIFVHDRQTGETEQVSVSSDGTFANYHSYEPVISADGRYVTFHSSANNLVDGADTFVSRVYVHDRNRGETQLVSVATDGSPANLPSEQSAISADGSRIAFQSHATNLVADDTNGKADIFVRDLTLGTTARVSINGQGDEFDAEMDRFSLSADGNIVVFGSLEAERQINESRLLFHDLSTGITTEKVIDSSKARTFKTLFSISADGSEVAFSSRHSSLVRGDTNGEMDMFVYDYDMETIERASLGDIHNVGAEANNWTVKEADVSADGRFVVFASQANNLIARDNNDAGHNDIFLRDRYLNRIWRVSIHSDGTEANGNSLRPTVSDDGDVIAFSSDAGNLVDGDTNDSRDIFVHQRSTGETVRVSVAGNGAEGNGWSFHPMISGDGRYIVYSSEADNLVANDTNGSRDIFVHDRQAGITTRVSVADNGTQANGGNHFPSISADGTAIAFYSDANNLVINDYNASGDIFVHDRTTGDTTVASVGASGGLGNGRSFNGTISADGQTVVFLSEADNLASGRSMTGNIFVHNRQTTTTASLDIPIAEELSEWFASSDDFPVVSANGRFVAFSSQNDQLVADDNNGQADSFVYDRDRDELVRVSVNSEGAGGDNWSASPQISADGRVVVFAGESTNLVANDTNNARDIFVHERDISAIPTAVTLASRQIAATTLPFALLFTLLLGITFPVFHQSRSGV